MMRRRFFALLIAAAFALATAMPIGAADSSSQTSASVSPSYSATYSDGAGYYSNVSNGSVISQPAFFALFGGMLASVSYQGGSWSDYTSGEFLSNVGSYKVKLYSDTSDEVTVVSFKVLASASQSDDYTYIDNLVEPQNQVDPNTGESVATIGSWTYDGISIASDTEHSDTPSLPSSDSLIGGGSSSSSSGSDGTSGGLPDTTGGDTSGTSAYSPVESVITGIYHDDYDLYEMSFAGKYFYTNIDNGAITSGQVTFDIPADILTVLEKDGVAASFTSNTPISESGSYLLTLQTTDSTGTVYTGTFRFRIQPAVSKQTNTQTSDESDELSWDDLNGEDLSGDEEDYTDVEPTGSTDGEDETADTPVSVVQTLTGLTVSYDLEKDMFKNTATSGYVFYSSLPYGSITNGPVYFSFPDAPSDLVMTLNDETYDYTPGNSLSENGAYCMTMGESDLSMALAGSLPQFCFRIVSGAVNNLDYYCPPEGYTIISATRDSEPVTFEPSAIMLNTDGQYKITAESDSGGPTQELSFLRDTTPPEFVLNQVVNGKATGSEVTVEFLSDDIDRTVLYLNDEETRFNGVSITDPGSYVMMVYDKAGNCSEQSFVLNYHINVAGVLLVLLMLALVAGAVVFYLRTRRDMRVR